MVSEAINVANVILCSPPIESRKVSGLSFQLDLEGFDMIAIHMGVAHLQYEFVGFRIGYQGDHVGEERVSGDVEGDAKSEITRALIHQARKKRLW